VRSPRNDPLTRPACNARDRPGASTSARAVIIPITVSAWPVRPSGGFGAGCGRRGKGEAMKAWMKREQWFVWIAAAIVLTIVLAAIGYVALAAQTG
jgi:hypothetical protein